MVEELAKVIMYFLVCGLVYFVYVGLCKVFQISDEEMFKLFVLVGFAFLLVNQLWDKVE